MDCGVVLGACLTLTGEWKKRTGISVPAAIIDEARRLADELGMSLSEFCVAALAAYVAAQQIGDVTSRLNEVYGREESTLEAGLVATQIASIEGQGLHNRR